MSSWKTFQGVGFGLVYLVSGVYSLGFSLLLGGALRPVSGNPAVVVAPDALFPFEIALFAVFGVAFFLAAAIEVRRSFRMLAGEGNK